MANHNLTSSSDPDNSFSCVACRRPDSADNLVACDRCHDWWHYSCAGVNGSVADRDWFCQKCIPPGSKSHSTISSSTRRARAELLLQRLAEKKELEKKQFELELEKKYMEEKYRLLDQTLEEEEEVRSYRSAISRMEKVQDWVEKSAEVCGAGTRRMDNEKQLNCPEKKVELEGAVGGECISATRAQQSVTTNQPAVTGKKLPHPLEASQTQPMSQELEELLDQLKELQPLQKEKLPPIVTPVNKGAVPKTRLSNVDPVNRTSQQQDPKTTRPQTLKMEIWEMPKVPPRRNLYASYSDSPPVVPARNTAPTGQQRPVHPMAYDFPMQATISSEQQRHFTPSDEPPNPIPLPQDGRSNPPTVPQLFYTRPTPDQLAARQVLPRDLPTFTGNPADWPVFISNYNYTTEACGYSDGENMIRLQRCLKGAAWESVRSRLILPGSVPHVIEALRMRYGRSELLIESLIERVKSSPSPRADRLETMIEFGTMVQALCDHIVAADMLDHLGNPCLLKDLISKLPADYRMKWAGYRRGQPTTDLKTFATFMEEIVADAYSVSAYASSGSSDRRGKTKQPDRSLVHTTDSCEDDESKHSDAAGSDQAERPVVKLECSVCAKVGHKARECRTFKSLSVDDRWKKIQELSLCRTCLYGHGRRTCRNTTRCGIDGCQARHHPLLHSTPKSPAPASSNHEQSVEHHVHHVLPSLYFRILPVTLHYGTTSIDTYAFLDEGSSLTMVEDSLATRLGVDGYKQPLCLKWTANMTRQEQNSKRVSFEISGLGEKCVFL